jgi:hypothetical protein
VKLLTSSRKQAFYKYDTLLFERNHELPHCPQLHKGQMQHYAAKNHSLSQEALAKVPNHHYMLYLLGYVCPAKNT